VCERERERERKNKEWKERKRSKEAGLPQVASRIAAGRKQDCCSFLVRR